MALQHDNLVRRSGGEQLVRELELAAAAETGCGQPTEDAIRRRTYEIHLSRHGISGRAEADWLRAEAELHAYKVAAAQLA